ncbi:MAG: cob(I)yrinic acid a,c-diamide adenosyltransferase [Muribaculaceae bacterium]|nr:cob(I)yrinic acid a,c-diamide adenosyltransferase [Muribaculaceae bacterium]
MAKSKIYTRTGDGLTTSLVGGERIPKYSLRLEAYGTIDEFSSFLGLLLSDDSVIDQERYNLLNVQNMLFNIGAYLATPYSDHISEVMGLSPSTVGEVENWIDNLVALLPEQHDFILPGGCEAASKAHVARTVCRRAERRIIELSAHEPVNPLVISYINRLSDYLFILARYLNKCADFEEVKWRKP